MGQLFKPLPHISRGDICLTSSFGLVLRFGFSAAWARESAPSWTAGCLFSLLKHQRDSQFHPIMDFQRAPERTRSICWSLKEATCNTAGMKSCNLHSVHTEQQQLMTGAAPPLPPAANSALAVIFSLWYTPTCSYLYHFIPSAVGVGVCGPPVWVIAAEQQHEISVGGLYSVCGPLLSLIHSRVSDTKCGMPGGRKTYTGWQLSDRRIT